MWEENMRHTQEKVLWLVQHCTRAQRRLTGWQQSRNCRHFLASLHQRLASIHTSVVVAQTNQQWLWKGTVPNTVAPRASRPDYPKQGVRPHTAFSGDATWSGPVGSCPEVAFLTLTRRSFCPCVCSRPWWAAMGPFWPRCLWWWDKRRCPLSRSPGESSSLSLPRKEKGGRHTTSSRSGIAPPSMTKSLSWRTWSWGLMPRWVPSRILSHAPSSPLCLSLLWEFREDPGPSEWMQE